MMVIPASVAIPAGVPRVPSCKQMASQEELSEKESARGRRSLVFKVQVLRDQTVSPGTFVSLGLTTVSKLWGSSWLGET